MIKYRTLAEVIQTHENEETTGITFISHGKPDRFVSYKQVYFRALSILYSLQKKGLKSGDECIFQITDNEYFIYCFWACVMGGIIPIPVSVGSDDEYKLKLFRIWNNCHTPFLLIDPDTLANLESFALLKMPDVQIKQIKKASLFIEDLLNTENTGNIIHREPGDTVIIQFSSGATGYPKGANLTHQNLFVNMNAILEVSNSTHMDSSLSWMPLTHDMGLIGFHITPIVQHMNQYIMSLQSFILTPSLWLKKASEYRVSILSSTNFGLYHVINAFRPEDFMELDLSAVRILFLGAEPISSSLAGTFIDKFKPNKLRETALYPVYGLAEATLAVAFPVPNQKMLKITLDRHSLQIGSKIRVLEAFSEGAITFVGVGSRVNECRIRICDYDDRELEEDTIGQIQVQGKNVIRSYYNNEKETALSFTHDGWMKTGDAGFFHNGCLVVTGRIKDIIIINGQNYYLDDIDRIVKELPQLHKRQIASVCYFDDKTQKEELLLFVIYRKKNPAHFILLITEIQKYLFSRIGLKFTYIIPVQKIPNTTSGKIMRYRLREGFESGEFNSIIDKLTVLLNSNCTNNDTPAEISITGIQIMHILKKVFHLDIVKPENTFFELGGDSFKAGLFITSLNKEFHVKIKMDDLFYYPSIRELAGYIDNLQKSRYEEIPKAENKQYYCLSPAQRRMFVLYKLHEDSTAYNLLVVLKIDETQDKRMIEDVFNKIIKRHESLRTSFIYHDGIPVQCIHKKVDFRLQTFSVSGKDASTQIYNHIKELKKPFDLTNDQLLIRAGIILLSGAEYLLVLCVPHIIADGTSIFLLIKEFAYFYRNLSLSPPVVQYKDYSEWFHLMLKKEKRMKEQEEYWLDQFKDGIPVLKLITDYPRLQERELDGSTVSFNIDAQFSGHIKELVKSQKATLFMVLLACYYILLYKYTCQEDIVVGTPVSGRLHPDVQDVVGLFVNTLCLRNKPSGNKRFTDFLNEVKESVFKALTHQEYQFEHLVEKLNIKRNLARNPVFDTMFVLHAMEVEIFELVGLKASRYPFENDTSMFDITFHIFEKKYGIDIAIEYSIQLFKKTTIENFEKHYKRILQSIVNDPGILIKSIDINTEDEREKIIYGFNANDLIIPDMTILSLFEEQVKRHPDTIAVVSQDCRITYRCLNDKAGRIAELLITRGMEKDSIAGLMAGRTVDLIIGIMAILKAGGAYLPVDLTLPVNRINYILKDCKVKILLAQGEIWQKDIYKKIKVDEIVYIDDPSLFPSLSPRNPGKPPVHRKPDDPVYVIYTSGTTGKPKGIVIEQRNVLNLIYGLKKKIYDYFSGSLNVCLVSSLSFDASVQQLFPALLFGHTLYIMPDSIKKDSLEIINFYIRNNIDISDATPTFLHFLIKGLKQKNVFFPIKFLIVGGEVLPKKTIMNLLEYIKPDSCKIANVYGPTECCVDSTFFEIDPQTLAHYFTIPIGKPMPNEQIYIFDSDMNVAPPGIPGELYISGEGIGKGYIQKGVLIRDHYVKNPFIEGKKMYKTGDLARWLPDGNIEFLGRIDKQVKVRGYRIEPEEIEMAIREHPGINDVVVVAKEFFPGDTRLVAYILTNFLIYWDDMVNFLKRKASSKFQTCRRSDFRVEYQSPCSLKKSNGNSYDTQTIDISYHGISIRRNKIPVVLNEEVFLSMILPDSAPITVRAINTYHTDESISLRFHVETKEDDIIKKAVNKIAKEMDLIVFDFRRSEYRIPINGKCVVKSADKSVIEVSVRDFSHSGTSLTAFPENFNSKGELELYIVLEKSHNPIKINGTIVWQSEKEVGIKFKDMRNYLIHTEIENHIQHRKLTVRDLQKFLEKRLPDYMIPSIFIIIDTIPFTQNGKIDFDALPEPHLGEIKGTMYEPPVSDIETELIKVWQDVLGIKRIGINDNFFEIGGDSFKALEMAMTLQSEYNVDINDIINNQTISQLVRVITPKTQKTKKFLQDLYVKYEKTLNEYNKRNIQTNTSHNYFYIDYEEKYKTIDLNKTKEYESILITGVTGYLGAYLAAELLKQTKSKLFVLIRGRNDMEVETRLVNTFTFYFGYNFYDEYKSRITIINGDLAKESMGLNDHIYNELSDSIDCIINSAAIVKHFGNVSEFIEVNVKGPERLLLLCEKGREKDFHHISTMSVVFGEILDNKPVLFTEVKGDIASIFDNEYIKTKKESERIVMDWRKEGVNTTVYRTGTLMTHSQTGQFQKNIDENAFYRFLKSIMKLKCIPEVSLANLDFSFINYVSKAIVLLVTRQNLSNEVFHIFNPNRISLVDLALKLSEINMEMNVMSFNDFLDFLLTNYKNKNLKMDIINIVYYLYLYVSIKSTDFILRSKKTENLLKRLGFAWEKVDSNHIKRMVEYAQAIRYFE